MDYGKSVFCCQNIEALTMKNSFTLLSLFFFVFTIQAQDPNILWQRTIGGSDYDFLSEIITTSDGGFAVGGYSRSNISGEKSENSRGEEDYWVLKFDSFGEIEWQRTFGGTESDILGALKQTADGGFMVGGTSFSGISGDKTDPSKGYSDFWILKLDASGNIEWQKTIGGNGADEITEIIQTPDGGFFIGGSSSSDISGDRTEPNYVYTDAWILKLDSNGNILWQKSHDFIENLRLSTIISTNDEGYLLGGYDYNPPVYYIMRINKDGFKFWERPFVADGFDILTNAIQTSDGGYVVIGFSDSNISGDKTEDSNGFDDYWILKIDSVGNIEWQNTIGGNLSDGCYTVIETPDNGYFITGYSDSEISGDKTENSLGSADYWIMKLNSVGIIEWQNTIGGSDGERVPKAVKNIDDSFIIAGQSRSNISGDKTENSRGGYDFWIIKHAQTLGLEENPFYNAITLYPNPVKNTLQLNTKDKTINQINIYTITGSKVLQLEVNTVSPIVDVSSLATGIYYVQLYSGKNVALKKFVKE